ncbi:MAG: nucleotidyltransferase domain-containing protein [Planctomycetes bacterium]|nr:nucleotidyltransferase domain-containing protein [Planctomycetota bacterium]
MSERKKDLQNILDAFKERAKELRCLYTIEELLSAPDAGMQSACKGMIEAIPLGWQYPDLCQVQIVVGEKRYATPGFQETPWVLSEEILCQEKKFGRISVSYREQRPDRDIGPFLQEEKKLLEIVTDRFGHFLLYLEMKQTFKRLKRVENELAEDRRKEWEVVLELLRQTDRELFLRTANKMLNFLCWSGVREAEELRRAAYASQDSLHHAKEGHANRPHPKSKLIESADFAFRVFTLAAPYLKDEEILTRIQRWVQEDRFNALVLALHKQQPLAEVLDLLRRYYHSAPEGKLPPSYNARGVQVHLIRRILSDQLDFIGVAKEHIDIEDIYQLLQTTIFTAESRGMIGGKSAGMFLADQILKKSETHAEILKNVKVPKTWYMPTDMVIPFMHYNNFDEIVEQKYKEINQVRIEYPHIVQSLKNARFPPDMVQAVSVALDDFGDVPLIVRSSSLLEDQVGAVFSGKYKSLFLANRGSREERLEALLDAIAEVYASTFGPDPIEYRAERGFLDFKEEMGVMIQQVVGTRVGKYFFPAFGGVAFSRNEFRWSPRIRREDGVVRLVPGLGTRAVDRISDDYPVLFAPGQPGLKVNVSLEDQIKYSPQRMDVINLETNTFETVPVCEILKNHGDHYPMAEQIVSVFDGTRLARPMGLTLDFEKDDLVVTFDGLISNTPFVARMQAILDVLEEKLHGPVDVEFASDGSDFYLLQCRHQSAGGQDASSPIPTDLAEDRIVFTAERFVSNGHVPEITHIVYVNPFAYAGLSELDQLKAVGRCVGRLNEFLPRRQFILMGPGRWGSRGDIRLGVDITYSDINNTAMLIEIARKKGKYLPDLSFGTHFFQDLVEAEIRYLPLYPDDEGIVFNEKFLEESPNLLPGVLPQYAGLAHVVRLIEVPKNADGRILKVLMNADLDRAVGYLTSPGTATVTVSGAGERGSARNQAPGRAAPDAWRWRLTMAERIAALLDAERFGVKGIYLVGSTRNNIAGPASDLDLLVHFQGDENQRRDLDIWFQAWSLSLDEINFLNTGYRTGGLLDIHYVTDEDIASKRGPAKKIDAATDAALPLKMKE